MNNQEEVRSLFKEVRGLFSILKFEPKLGELIRLKELVQESINDNLRPCGKYDEFHPAYEAVARFFWERYGVPVQALKEGANPVSLKELEKYIKMRQEEMYLL
jgi:hypothetical protein